MKNPKMSSISIFHLNVYCLFEILKYIKINCESIRANVNEVKYADLINLSLTCEEFRQIICLWEPQFYERVIEEHYLLQSPAIVFDFKTYYQRLQKTTQKEKDIFWKMITNALKSNTNLRTISLKFLSDMYYSEHTDIFNMLLNVLQSKNHIKSLDIHMDGYSLDNLDQFPGLNNLSLNLRLKATELARYCKLNPSLKSLDVMSEEVYGRLSDIVPYCNKLEKLRFKVKRHSNNNEYMPLAKIPRLTYLHIEGQHEMASLNSLINHFTIKEPQILKTFVFKQTEFDIGEIMNVLKIQSLKQFKFSNDNLYLKTHSNNINAKVSNLFIHFQKAIDASQLGEIGSSLPFQRINLYGSHIIGTLTKLFNAIASQKPPQLKSLKSSFLEELSDVEDDIITIEHGDETIMNNEEFIEALKIASLKTMDCNISDTRPIACPGQLPNIEELNLWTRRGGLMVNLFHAFALQESPKLTILSLSGGRLSCEEIFEISQIDSLKSLRCGFANINSIEYLAQMRHLESVSICSEHNIKTVTIPAMRLFAETNGNLSIYYKKSSIEKKSSELCITDFLHKNSKVFEPLTNLNNFNHLKIKLTFYFPLPILKAFADKEVKFLKYLTIDSDGIGYDDVAEINRIKTLMKIYCSFEDIRSIRLLQLPKIELLNFYSTHTADDLLLGVLHFLEGNSNKITIQNYDHTITFNASQSELIISNEFNMNDDYQKSYALLAGLPDLKSLRIRGRHRPGSFSDLFSALATRKKQDVQKITIESKLTEIKDVAKILSLKSLECRFTKTNLVVDIALLGELPELEELVITDYYCDTLKPLLNRLASKGYSKLESLIFKGYLTSEESNIVGQINSLRRLEFQFAENVDYGQIAKLKELEELTLTIKWFDQSILKLLQKLACRKSKTFQYLNIGERPISYEDMKALVGIKSLKGLRCALSDVKSFQLLDNLPKLEKLVIDCDTIDIKTLSQLNKLSELSISGSTDDPLNALFKELSIKPTNLQNLTLTYQEMDVKGTQEIAKLKSLKKLKCGFNPLESIENVKYLVNLEELDIIHHKDFNLFSQYVLEILQACQKLKIIHFTAKYLKTDFLEKAMNILKNIRNTELQGPLQMIIDSFDGLTFDQMAIVDEKFLSIPTYESQYNYFYN